MSELRQFVTQLYALPCVLSQTPLLKVTGEAPVKGLAILQFVNQSG